MPDQFSFLDHLSKNDRDEYRKLADAALYSTDAETRKKINARLAELTVKGREGEDRQEKFGEAYASEHVADEKQDLGRGDVSPENQRPRAEAGALREHHRLQESGGGYGSEHHPSNIPTPATIANRTEQRQAAEIVLARQQQEARWDENGGFPGFRPR